MEHIFPIGVFPESIQDIIKELNRDRKFPIDYLGGAILWVVSVLIGATSYLKTSLAKTYCNVYMMLIGVHSYSFLYNADEGVLLLIS